MEPAPCSGRFGSHRAEPGVPKGAPALRAEWEKHLEAGAVVDRLQP